MVTLKLFFLVLCTFSFSLNRSTFAYRITGAPGTIDPRTGSLPQRLEINDFARAGPSFDLFVLALAELQSLNQTDQLSYFRVAGIHGFPAIPWDGVAGQPVPPGNQPIVGYCMHSSVLFPLWHRPYLALFEQLIWNHARTIANAYPPDQVAKYKEAALSLRIPYWDWAVNPALPTVYTTPTIFVNGPSGWGEIQNPMYRYDFHPGPEGNGFGAGFNLSNAPYTTRCGNSMFVSNENEASERMLRDAPGNLASVYELFSSVTNYTNFASASGQGSINIEAIHNAVHTFVGCDSWGSMWEPHFAAFDPIFWLHHAQVDRITALWQALHPNNYVTPYINAWGSYYQPRNTVDTVDTFLAPFHINDGARLFTAREVASTAVFGYTYPELRGLNDVARSADQQAILRSRINQIYNPAIGVAQNRQTVNLSRRATSLATAFTHVSLSMAQELGVNNLEIQWSVRIQMQLLAYASPVTLHFFMGAPPDEINQWSTAPNLVGTFAQFRSAGSASRFSYSRGGESMTYGSVSLTHILAAGVSRGYLSALKPSEIVPLLKENLRWRASTSDHHEIQLDQVFGLSIAIRSRRVKPAATPREFPVYGSYQIHVEATAGKVGGASHA